MYAVVSSGGKQYRVEPGATLTMERVGVEPGAEVTFDRVLLIGDGESVTVGTPVVDGASVSGTVLAEELGPKLVIFKFKQKVKYRRRTGHRQHLVRVRIDAINADGKRTRTGKAESKADAETKAEAAAEEKPKRTRPTTKSASAKSASAKAETAEKAAAPAEEKPKRTRASAKTSSAKGASAKSETAEKKPRASRAKRTEE